MVILFKFNWDQRGSSGDSGGKEWKENCCQLLGGERWDPLCHLERFYTSLGSHISHLKILSLHPPTFCFGHMALDAMNFKSFSFYIGGWWW